MAADRSLIASQPATWPTVSTARIILAALGLTTIDFLWIIKPAVEPSQHALYHWSGAPRLLFGATALDMFGGWVIVAVFMFAARRPGRVRIITWAGLLLSIPWFVLLDTELLGLTRSHNHVARALFLVALLGTVLLAVAWRPSFVYKLEKVVGTAITLLFFMGVFGLFLLGRLAFFGWQAGKLHQRFPLHLAEAGQVNGLQRQRVIWIVLDELSYQQVYEHRFLGLSLPAFYKLATQSTIFSRVEPLGTATEVVLPGLLSGKPLDEIMTSSTGRLSVHNGASGAWSVFDQHDTVFQDALDARYSTGVAGWYNPYCRIMNEVLDQCMWTHRFEILNGMVPSGTVLSNTLQPIELLATKLLDVGSHGTQVFFMSLLHIPKDSVKSATLHIEDYESLYKASNALILDRSAGFILLHLPVPHPEGIYDRTNGTFTTAGSSYIDNLVLADKCVGGLRAELEQTDQWDSSAVVIMGDHSWRTTQLWRSTRAWTATEQAASLGGGYDERPVYIVKLPGQMHSARVDTSFRAVNSRKLFDALLNHQIKSSLDLTTWAANTK